jgi:hypothetical protein
MRPTILLTSPWFFSSLPTLAFSASVTGRARPFARWSAESAVRAVTVQPRACR